MNKISIEDIYNYRFLNNVKAAPDGNSVAFVNYMADLGGKCYNSDIWLWKNGKAKALTEDGTSNTFVWEDDTHILVQMVRSQEEQERKSRHEIFTSWYRLDITSGECAKAFELPLMCRNIVRFDSSRWIFLSKVSPDKPDLWKAGPQEKAKFQKMRKENADYRVVDTLPFRFNGIGYMGEAANVLFVYDQASDSIERLTEPDFNIMKIAVLNGKIYYSGAPKCKVSVKYDDIYCLDVETKTAERVYAEEKLSVLEIAAVEDQLLVVARDRINYGFDDDPKIYTLDSESKDLKRLADPGRNLENSVLSDCSYGTGNTFAAKAGKLYFLETVGYSSIICSVDFTGEIHREVVKTGSVISFDVTDDGSIYGICSYDMKLNELYKMGAEAEPRRLTDFNGKAIEGCYVAKPEHLQVEACGFTIDGWVMKPFAYDPSKKYPAVLNIHGGPKNVFSEVFFHQQQLWAASGYFAMYCNPVGSDGKGAEFCQAIRSCYGTKDYESIMAFTDRVLEMYPQIDAGKLVVEGGSYGGFMTNWIIGHTDRFVCAISQRSMSNLISMYGTGDVGYNSINDKNGGDIFSAAQLLWQQSPVKYADKVTTPTLFIHSEEDYRCPLEQALQMYTAIKARGVDAKLIIFKGENHGLSRNGKPVHRIKRLKEMIKWAEEHICK